MDFIQVGIDGPHLLADSKNLDGQFFSQTITSLDEGKNK
jgi:hypothetical protein